MSLIVKRRKGNPIPPMEAGTYSAVCVGVIDLGEHYSDRYKKFEQKVMLMWEIPSVRVMVDGKEGPRLLSKDFSSTLSEKSALYNFLVPWRSRGFTDNELYEGGFSLDSMLGQGCFLQVIIKEGEKSTYNKITTVIAPPNGMPTITPESELIAFDIDEWDEAKLEKLPSWVQDRIKKSTQYKKLHVPQDEVDFSQPAANPVDFSELAAAVATNNVSHEGSDLPFTVGDSPKQEEACPI